MSFWKSLGKVARQAAPFASFIPGVGPIAAGVLGAGGAALEGGGVKGALMGGLGGYVGSSGISAATGGRGIAGIGAAVARQGGWKNAGVNVLKSKLGIGGAGAAAAGAAGGAGGPDVIPTDTYYNPDGSIKSQTPRMTLPDHGLPSELLPTSGGGNNGTTQDPGLMGNIWNWAKSHPDLLLAGGSAIMGAKGNADAARRRDRALGSLSADYAKKAPIRDLSLSTLTSQNPQIANLTKIFSNRRPYEVPQVTQ